MAGLGKAPGDSMKESSTRVLNNLKGKGAGAGARAGARARERARACGAPARPISVLRNVDLIIV